MSMRRLSSSGYVTQRLLRRHRPPSELSVFRRFILSALRRSLFFFALEGFDTYAGSRYLRDFNVAHASEPTKVTKNKGKPGAAAAHSDAEGSFPQPA